MTARRPGIRARLARRPIDARGRLAAAGRHVAPLLVVALAVAAVWPALAAPGLVATRAGGDSPFLLQRVHQMAAALAAGNVPPRWMPDAAFGLGYPFWNYYAPLAYLVAGGLVLLGGSVIGSIKVTVLVAFVAAAAGAHRLAARRWGAPAGVLAAAAYTMAPYHMVNLYVRGDALSELAAYAVFPWLLLAIDAALAGPGAVTLVGLAVASGLLALAHNISALLFAPVAAAYAAWRVGERVATALAARRRPGAAPDAPGARASRRHAPPGVAPAAAVPARGALAAPAVWSWRALLAAERRLWPHRPRGLAAGLGVLVLGALLGAGITAWFWAPAAWLEQGAVQLAGNLEGYFDFHGHFRGASLVGRELVFDYAIGATDAPWRIGSIQLAFAVLGLAVGWTERAGRSALAFWALVAAGAGLMITPLSAPVWEALPLLAFAQFPWRWLSVVSLALALVTAPLATGRARWPIALVAAATLAVAAMAGLRVEALGDPEVTADDLAIFELLSGNVGSTVRAEYLPRGVALAPRAGLDVIDGREGAPRAVPGEGTLEGSALIRSAPTRQEWQLRLPAGAPVTVAWPTHHFPGWEVSIDGAPPVPARSAASSGWLQAEIDPDACRPAGRCEVVLTLGRSAARALAEGFSLLALLALCAVWLTARHPLRPRWIVLAAAAVALGAAGARTLPAGPAAGPIVFDWDRAPYPHRPPGGVRFGEAHLRAADLLAPGDGEDAAPLVSLVAGEPVTVRTGWSGAPAGWSAEVALVTPTGRAFDTAELDVPDIVWATETHPLDHPGAHLVEAPAEMPPGVYLLRLTVSDAAGLPVPARTAAGTRLDPLYVGAARVRSAGGAAGGGTVGVMGDITLREVTPEQRGGRLDVRLVWATSDPLTVDYKTSVRLLDTAGDNVAQDDKRPLYGFLPTTAWPAGEGLIDHRFLRVPDDVDPDGDYTLEIVVYEPSSGQEIGSGRRGGLRLTPVERPAAGDGPGEGAGAGEGDDDPAEGDDPGQPEDPGLDDAPPPRPVGRRSGGASNPRR